MQQNYVAMEKVVLTFQHLIWLGFCSYGYISLKVLMLFNVAFKMKYIENIMLSLASIIILLLLKKTPKMITVLFQILKNSLNSEEKIEIIFWIKLGDKTLSVISQRANIRWANVGSIVDKSRWLDVIFLIGPKKLPKVGSMLVLRPKPHKPCIFQRDANHSLSST